MLTSPLREPNDRGHAAVAIVLAAVSLLTACAIPAGPAPGTAGTTMSAAASAAERADRAGTTATERLHQLFDDAWEAGLRRTPEWATFVGDHRFGDRLQDASPEAEAAGYAELRQQLATAQAIPPDALAPVDRVSRDVFIDGLQDRLRFEPLIGFRSMSLSAQGGFQSQLADLLQAVPMATTAQAEQALARMAAMPRRVDQELARLRQGSALGWVPPRKVQERVLASLDTQLAAVGETSPWFAPFKLLGPDIPPATQQVLRERAKRVITEQVAPAHQKLRDFVANEYLPKAPVSGALSGYPGGAAVYAARVAQQTTTTLSALQIHEIGLREVARLRGEIDGVMREMKWTGDFTSFANYLNTDPKFFHPTPQALLSSYRDIAKRIDAELPRLFAELPRAPYGVRAMPDFSGPDRAEYYDMPALDGTRPGWFNANLQGYKTRPTWGQETLTAHEAVPGHHLQTARALELGELPKFRRANWYVAYGEGWALYAETLGFELGLYKDPASRFGHLQSQMFRASRLVVDTGIHSLGWSRQQAIDYMVAQTGDDRGFVESEIDRYTSWPGQALGYMIGNLKFAELRDRARAALGANFDIRRFHMVLLDSGALPLVVLERQVDEWIAVERAKPRG